MTKKEAIEFLEIEIHCEDKGDERDLRKAMDMGIEALKQELKTGHWTAIGYYCTGAYDHIDIVRCSKCGEDSLEKGSYCPNCGIKMKSEGIDEDYN